MTRHGDDSQAEFETMELPGRARPEAAVSEADLVRRVFTDRMVLEHLPDVVCLLDRNQHVTYLSRNVLPLGRVHEVLGTRATEYVAHEHQARFHDTFESAWTNCAPCSLECLMRDGVDWWQTRLVPIQQDGVVVRMLVAAHVITEHVREQRARHENESRLRQAMSLVGMGTWSHDWRSDEVVWDDALRTIFGVAVSPRGYRGFLARVHPEDRERVHTTSLRARDAGEYNEIEFRIVRPNGELRKVRTNVGFQQDSEGKIFGSLGAVFDVTDRSRLEAQLSQRRKVEALGGLMTGIAHNFNNLLGVILPNVELCIEDAPPSLANSLNDIQVAALQAADLIRQLMLFVQHDQAVARTSLDPAALLRHVAQVCRTTFDRGIELELEVAPDVPQIRGNAGQLEQVLLNLCSNARDALAEARITAPRIDLRLERCGSGAVRIRVHDNGPGMTEQTRARIFEPFFTTKKLGEGTGLGLATAAAIVRDHGGRLNCESSLGSGALFEIELPAEYAPADAPAARPAPTSHAGGGETLLLVDDEAPVRRATRATLVRRGYQVLECQSGAEALALFMERPLAIDLVLLDRSMPGQSGDQVLRELKRLAPKLPVVMFSGQPFVSANGEAADAALIKPVTSDVLLRTIRSLLDRRLH